MFETYTPRKFCREFVEIEGSSSQIVMVMAVVKGIKPCMDTWVRIDKYNNFRKACRRYGLFLKTDAIFNQNKNIPINAPGRERLTTTKAAGFLFNNKYKFGDKDDYLHIFISRAKDSLEKCFKNGWYPLVINNRVIDKPIIDAFKFGYDLGYPECCVSFFQRYNDWFKYSYLYEIFRNTSPNRYNYLCNPFTKDAFYSYIYHMPCSYSCLNTIGLANKIRVAIKGEEPEFVRAIDRHLRLPVLVFYERKFYAFEGVVKQKRLYYKSVYFIGAMPENNIFDRDLRRGNCVFVDNKDVIILNNGKLIKRIKWHKSNFAPETPFIIQFN